MRRERERESIEKEGEIDEREDGEVDVKKRNEKGR